MIEFNYLCDFSIDNESLYSLWIENSILSENKKTGDISFIFCSDDYLLDINQKHLNHDYYTDIISFDYSEQDFISGDFFISIDRVQENADLFHTTFLEELRRVMIHGILHCSGYSDKNDTDTAIMRDKENEKLKTFHVEH